MDKITNQIHPDNTIQHPLNPLTPEELNLVVDITKQECHLDERVLFETVCLLEPEKNIVQNYQSGDKIHRKAFVAVLDRNSKKTYEGIIQSVASRVDAQTRSILARAQIKNENSEIIPGSLLEIEILYNEKNTLSIPDTSIMYEGSKKFVYKIIENNIIKKTEITTGVRDQENLEVIDGLIQGDKVVGEGLTKVRSNMKIKPIIKSQ